MTSISHNTEIITKSYVAAFSVNGERQGTAKHRKTNTVYMST